MNYKNIALYLLLLFTTNQTHPMEWVKNNPITSLSAAVVISTVALGTYKEVTEGFTILTEILLWPLYKKISKNNHWILARCFVLFGKGEKLLFHAYAHNKELFLFLIKSGVNPNVIHRGTIPYLSKACSNEDENLVKTLLEHGADPDNNNKFYNSSWSFGGGTECFSYERGICNNGSPLCIAFYKNNHKIIQLLTHYNAQPLTSPSNYDNQKSNPLDPAYLLQYSDYTSFNHLLDYAIKKTDSTLENKKTSVYKYWLINQALQPKDIIDNKIMPHVIIFKNFDQHIEDFVQSYPLPKKDKTDWKNTINKHKPNILQFRCKQADNFLPISLSEQERQTLLITQ